MTGLAAARMSGGSEFYATGPTCDKALSQNLVCNRGVTYLLLKADSSPVRVGYVYGFRLKCCFTTA